MNNIYSSDVTEFDTILNAIGLADGQTRQPPGGEAGDGRPAPRAARSADPPARDARGRDAGRAAPPDAPTLITTALAETIVHPIVAPVVRTAAPSKPTRSAGRRLAGWAARAARRTVAAGLLLAALWFWAVPFFFPVTSRAVVNARTVQVRAPVSGVVAALDVAVGDPVVAGQPVMRVAGRNVDVSQLATVRAKQAELTARRARLAGELEATTAAEAVCRADLARYTQAVVETLRATRQEGRAKLEMAEVEQKGADRRLGRIQDLAGHQVVGVNEHDVNKDTASVAKAKIDLERAALSRTEKELEAAGRGLFVARDAPAFQLQARELAFKIPRLKAEIREIDQLLAATAAAAEQEEGRVARLTDAPVPAPVSGVVWKRPGSLAQVVDRNEVVFDVADQTTIFVEAILHQRYLSSVVPGSRVVINLTGGATLTGRVRAVRTPNPDEAEPGFALSLTDRDLKQVKAVIALDPPVADPALIGRHARVLIVGPDPGPVERGVEWLFTRMRF